MEYTIQSLCKMAGVSSRTLRYYDQIDLLKPKKLNDAGYRIYGENEINRLQEILFYREFDIELDKIKEILNSDGYDRIKDLQRHINLLEKKRYRIDLIINNIKKTIMNNEGQVIMENWEKFQGIKFNYMSENSKYIEEIYSLYPKEIIDSTFEKDLNRSLIEYNNIEILGDEIINLLEHGVKSKIEPSSENGYHIFLLHKRWLKLSLAEYSCNIHLEMAGLYIRDERFTNYYDRNVAGCSHLLKDIIHYILT